MFIKRAVCYFAICVNALITITLHGEEETMVSHIGEPIYCFQYGREMNGEVLEDIVGRVDRLGAAQFGDNFAKAFFTTTYMADGTRLVDWLKSAK